MSSQVWALANLESFKGLKFYWLWLVIPHKRQGCGALACLHRKALSTIGLLLLWAEPLLLMKTIIREVFPFWNSQEYFFKNCRTKTIFLTFNSVFLMCVKSCLNNILYSWLNDCDSFLSIFTNVKNLLKGYNFLSR